MQRWEPGSRRAGPAIRPRLGAVLLLVACGREPAPTPAPASDAARCEQLVQAESYEQAATTCREVFDRTASPEAGVAAARALLRLGRHAEVVEWAHALDSTAGAGSGWAFAALAHEKDRDFEAASVAFARARDAFEARGEHLKAARAGKLLVRRLWLDQHMRRALEAADLALDLAERSGDPTIEGEVAGAAFGLLFDVGDLAAARWALGHEKALLSSDDALGRARVAVHEGNLHEAEGQLDLAHLAYERALAEPIDDPDVVWAARLSLVELALIRGDVDDAASRLEAHTAEADARAENDKALRTTLHHHRARLAEARGELETAARELDAGLADDPVAHWAWQLHHLRGRVQERRGDLAGARDEHAAAIEVLEHMREALGKDALQHWMLDSRRAPFETWFELEARAGAAMAALEVSERARGRSFLDAFVTQREATPITRWPGPEILARLDRTRALLRQGVTAQPAEAPSVSTSLAALGSLDAWVYFEAGCAVWVFVVHRGQPTLHRLPFDGDEIRRRIESWREELDDDARARAVAEAVVPPAPLPPRGADLLVVPDGALVELPFAALPVGAERLVERHALGYAPSLGVVAALRGATPPAPSGSGDAVVVLGDATDDLPSARAEATAVATALGASASLGSAARRARLEAARGASLLHVATHGGLDDRGAWIQLADGRVYAQDVIAGRIAPRHVVLASCASAARRGHGLWGSVAAAFLANGTRSAVASLWAVDDAAARRLVDALYEHDAGRQPWRALARAQRSFLARGEPTSQWGAFVVLGVPPPSTGSPP